jgi:hypothetical protein
MIITNKNVILGLLIICSIPLIYYFVKNLNKDKGCYNCSGKTSKCYNNTCVECTKKDDCN